MAKRVVRTAQGAAYYGVPIGTVIEADAEVASGQNQVGKAKGKVTPRVGINAPNSSDKSQAGSTQGAQSGSSPQIRTPNSSQPAQASTSNNQILPTAGTFGVPTISGPRAINIGGHSYNVPEGSRAFSSPNSTGVGYVAAPDGSMHVMVSGKEFHAPPEISGRLKRLIALDQDYLSEVTEEGSSEIAPIESLDEFTIQE